jgi:hypothetical protein
MTTLYKPRPDRWFRFSLRTLFVLVTVLGVFLGWLGVQVKWIRDRREARACSEEWANAYVVRIGPHTSTALASYFQPSTAWNYRPAPWSLRLFGEPGVYSIDVPSWVDDRDEEVRRMKRLFPEAEVSMREEFGAFQQNASVP